MKTTFQFQSLLRLLFIVMIMVFASACMTTKVISNQHTDNLANEQCQTTHHWKYWWGIGGSDEILVGPGDRDCACDNKAMATVTIKSSFGDFLLTAVTLGIVNHRKVSYQCAEVDDGEQNRR